MPHHNGASHADQIIFLEERHRRIVEKVERLRRVVSFYELARASEEAKYNGVMRDAVEWLLESAVELSRDPDVF